MNKFRDTTVVVRRRCDDRQRARYRIEDIANLHLRDIGAAGARRVALYGYVWCDAMLEGELAHQCARGDGAHQIRVCVLEKDNASGVYAELMGRIDEGAQVTFAR
jgi:hypothetical protein